MVVLHFILKVLFYIPFGIGLAFIISMIVGLMNIDDTSDSEDDEYEED